MSKFHLKYPLNYFADNIASGTCRLVSKSQIAGTE